MTWPSFLAAFVPQLLASLVGAGVGIYGVRLAFTWQRQASALDGVDQAVASLLESVATYASALDAYANEINITQWHDGQRPRVLMPYAGSVSIAVEILRLRTEGEDHEIANEISQTWSIVAHAPLEKRITASGLFAGAITKWRLGESRSAIKGTLETAEQLSLDDATSMDIRLDED